MTAFPRFFDGVEEQNILRASEQEVGRTILADLILVENELERRPDRIGMLMQQNYIAQFDQNRGLSEDARRAIMEGWLWLERQGAIGPDPEHLGRSPVVFVTRQGREIADRQ